AAHVEGLEIARGDVGHARIDHLAIPAEVHATGVAGGGPEGPARLLEAELLAHLERPQPLGPAADRARDPLPGVLVGEVGHEEVARRAIALAVLGGPLDAVAADRRHPAHGL